MMRKDMRQGMQEDMKQGKQEDMREGRQGGKQEDMRQGKQEDMRQDMQEGIRKDMRQVGRKVKCVVWDLDNTVWKGTLLEDREVMLRPDIPDIVRTLDERGILQSVASRNDYGQAMDKLREFGLEEYFLNPRIHWNSKSDSLREIAGTLNIGLDTLAFIDDQSFEREEVRYALPQVLCIDAARIPELLGMPEMNPAHVTEDARNRRLLYLGDVRRKVLEDAFTGTPEEFLETLDMRLTVDRAQEEDLRRVEELTGRTHQLNTTGYIYSYEELDAYRKSDRHLLLVAGLEDRLGTYGKIGVVLLEALEQAWTIKLLLMSCRVMSRGVGTVLVNHLIRLAREKKARLRAEFIHNDRNRMMYVTYKFAGFETVEAKGAFEILEHDNLHVQPYPKYMRMDIRHGWGC